MPVTPNHHNKKLTIHDIAEMAHVSAGTVSRVLNNQPGVGAQTRANIQAIIQEQGYQASFFARNLLARQSFAIGLVFSGNASELFSHPIFPELLGAIGDALTSAGYTLTLITGVSPERNQRILREAAEGRIDGLILPDIHLGDTLVDDLLAQDTPTVVIGHREQHADVVWIDCDNDNPIFQLTRSLIQPGHQPLALVNGPSALSSRVLAAEGEHSALEASGYTIIHT